MRVYATLTDYADWTDTPAPSTLDQRAFLFASRRLDRALIGARYDTDTAGMPTAAGVIEAMREATCAIVEAWIEAGDATGTGRLPGPEWGSVSIGGVSLSRPSTTPAGTGTTDLPEKAEDVLILAGLLPLDPYIVG